MKVSVQDYTADLSWLPSCSYPDLSSSTELVLQSGSGYSEAASWEYQPDTYQTMDQSYQQNYQPNCGSGYGDFHQARPHSEDLDLLLGIAASTSDHQPPQRSNSVPADLFNNGFTD